MKAKRKAFVRGATLLEAAVACAISSLLIISLLSIAPGVAQSNDRQLTEMPIKSSGRTTIDEMLFQLRAANGILPSQTLNRTKFTSDSQNIVFTAPAYNDKAADNSDVTLAGSLNTVAFSYDPARGNLYETIVPQTGSARKSRPRYLLASNVVGVAYTYYAHEHYHYSSPSILNQILSLQTSWP